MAALTCTYFDELLDNVFGFHMFACDFIGKDMMDDVMYLYRCKAK